MRIPRYARYLAAALVLVPLAVWAVDAVTANMGLTVPTPGVTTGPLYAQDINADLYLLDQHNHSPGKGVPVPTSGLNINADLTYNDFNATDLRSVALDSNISPLSLPGDVSCLYSVNGDLYYNDGAGSAVKITSGAALNASVLGGFTGLAGTQGEALYSPVAGTFTFFQSTMPAEAAGVLTGPITIYDTAAGVFGITEQSPVGLARAYSLTLPAGLPTTTRILLVSDAGVESYGPPAGGENGILQLSPTAGYTVGPTPLAQNALVEMNTDGGVYLGPPAPAVASLLTMGADGGVSTLALPANPGSQTVISMSSGGALSATPFTVGSSSSLDTGWSGTLSWWIDQVGMAHVSGFASPTSGYGTSVFSLPASVWPGSTKTITQSSCNGLVLNSSLCNMTIITITSAGVLSAYEVLSMTGVVSLPTSGYSLSFDGINYLAGH